MWERQQSSCERKSCFTALKPENAASNFSNPSLSVKIAVNKGIIKSKARVLEFGGGNLRNAMYILKMLPNIKIFCYELEGTIKRFANTYKKFNKHGGVIKRKTFGKRKYDAVICTYVLETICPEIDRIAALVKLNRCLKDSGILIGSFRGYPGVRGTKYLKCPLEEGLITPMKTFVRPYSLDEAKQFLYTGGFKNFQTLQKYKVEQPENIHFIAY